MADYQSLLDAVALVIGGTAPDLTNRPHFYSGSEVGDGTEMGHGTALPLKGCWSTYPAVIEDSPYAIVMPDSATISGPEKSDVFVLGEEWNVEVLRLQFYLALYDHVTAWPLIVPYRDLIPAVFRSHMQLNATANVITAMPRSLRAVVLEYATTMYVGWECMLHVQRVIQPTYSA